MFHVRILLVALAVLAPEPALAGSLDKTCAEKHGDKLDSCLAKNFAAQQTMVEATCKTFAEKGSERWKCRKDGYETLGIKITKQDADQEESGDSKADEGKSPPSGDGDEAPTGTGSGEKPPPPPEGEGGKGGGEKPPKK